MPPMPSKLAIFKTGSELFCKVASTVNFKPTITFTGKTGKVLVIAYKWRGKFVNEFHGGSTKCENICVEIDDGMCVFVRSTSKFNLGQLYSMTDVLDYFTVKSFHTHPNLPNGVLDGKLHPDSIHMIN